jgi:hypothetical protein
MVRSTTRKGRLRLRPAAFCALGLALLVASGCAELDARRRPPPPRVPTPLAAPTKCIYICKNRDAPDIKVTKDCTRRENKEFCKDGCPEEWWLLTESKINPGSGVLRLCTLQEIVD